jgi:hypothetical protein
MDKKNEITMIYGNHIMLVYPPVVAAAMQKIFGNPFLLV